MAEDAGDSTERRDFDLEALDSQPAEPDEERPAEPAAADTFEWTEEEGEEA